MRSLRGDSIKGFLWTSSSQGALITLRFLVLVVLARLLEPEEFGVMSAALIVLGFAELFYKMGVGPALVQRRQISTAHIRSGMTGSIVLSLAIGGLLVLTAPQIAAFFDFDDLTAVLRVVAIEFPILGITVVGRSLMQRALRFRDLAAISVVSYTLGYGALGISLAALGAGVWALVFAEIARITISAIILIVLNRRELGFGFKIQPFKELMVFGGGFTIANLFRYFAGQGDNIIVGRWLGAAALGIYGRAYQLVVFPVQQLHLVINQVLFPALSKMQDSEERVSSVFRRGTTVMALFFGPLSVVIIVLSPEIVSVILGSKWESVVRPLQILSGGMLFLAAYHMADTLAQAKGAVYRRAWRQGVRAGAVVLGGWIGQHWGLEGLTWGVLSSIVLNFVLMSNLGISLTSLGWRDLLQAIIPGVWLALPAVVAAWGTAGLMRAFDTPDIVTLITSVGAVAAILTVVIWRVPSIIGRDRSWIAEALMDALRHTGLTRGQRHSRSES